MSFPFDAVGQLARSDRDLIQCRQMDVMETGASTRSSPGYFSTLSARQRTGGLEAGQAPVLPISLILCPNATMRAVASLFLVGQVTAASGR